MSLEKDLLKALESGTYDAKPARMLVDGTISWADQTMPWDVAEQCIDLIYKSTGGVDPRDPTKSIKPIAALLWHTIERLKELSSNQ